MEFTELWSATIQSPAVALPIAVLGAVTLFRKLCAIWWPSFEKNRIYKTILHTLPYVLGITLAFCIKGVGFFEKATWPYLVVVGMVAAFANDIIWILFKAWIQKRLGLTKADIESAIKRKSQLPKPPADDEEDTKDEKPKDKPKKV